jgi:hypothetical protein
MRPGAAAGPGLREAHHYHQPSDEYRADWDFRGNAKMARFGFVLGWLASEQPKSIEWLPGDEFEAARKARVSESTRTPSTRTGFCCARLIQNGLRIGRGLWSRYGFCRARR